MKGVMKPEKTAAKKTPRHGPVQIAKNIGYMLSLLFRCCPLRVISELVLAIIIRLTTNVFYNVFFIKIVIDILETGKPFSNVIWIIGIMTVIYGISYGMQAWFYKYYKPKTDQTIYEKMNDMLFQKAMEVDLASFENPEFFDHYLRATRETNDRAIKVLDFAARFLGIVVSGITLIVFMTALEPMLILVTVIPVVITLILEARYSRYIYNFNQEAAPYERKIEYVKRTVYLNTYAKEIRLGNMFQVLKKQHEQARDQILKICKRIIHRAGAVKIVSAFLGQCLPWFAAIFYVLVRSLIFGRIPFSSMISLVNASNQLSGMLYWFMKGMAEMMEHSQFIQNIRDFLNTPIRILEIAEAPNAPSHIKELSFQNVSFSYDGKTDVLKQISFHIKAGEKIAIVGHNGAGKSTLVKLLTRLYDPTGGTIQVNGSDIRKLRLSSYRSLYACVFQDFQIFSLSLAENILMRKPENSADETLVWEAVAESGFQAKASTLPNGIFTTLTKEFDPEGAVLSGGETQKVAIARAFAANSPIIVMDEPTSALDPIAEHDMYENMMRVCEGKTVIFISHRLSSTVAADRIYLFEQGEIIEQGSHKELMERGGKYADMFNRQAESYLAQRKKEAMEL